MIREEKRERIEPYYVFITDDDKEFTTMYSALCHQAALERGKRNIQKFSAVDMNEDPIEMYFINSIDDFRFMITTEWFNIKEDSYVGEGWYLTISHDGGDHADWYEVYYWPNYVNYTQNWLNKMTERFKVNI